MADPRDTDHAAARILADLYLRMSPEEKLKRVRDLTQAASQLSLAGLRDRHPGETEGDLLLRLARLRLGGDVVDAAYGAARAVR